MKHTRRARQSLQQLANSTMSQIQAFSQLRRASGHSADRFENFFQGHEGATDVVVRATAVACKPVSRYVNSIQLHLHHLARYVVMDAASVQKLPLNLPKHLEYGENVPRALLMALLHTGTVPQCHSTSSQPHQLHYRTSTKCDRILGSRRLLTSWAGRSKRRASERVGCDCKNASCRHMCACSRVVRFTSSAGMFMSAECWRASRAWFILGLVRQTGSRNSNAARERVLL